MAPTPQLTLPTLLAAGALLLVPVVILAENTIANTWTSRLYQPLFQDEPNRHTPAHTDGTYLPPTISTDTTYTTTNNPVILTGTTEIPNGVTVTFTPGVHVVAHEFASLKIDGVLNIAGTAAEPVTFSTNEVHPDNQNWSGLLVSPGGKANITHTLIEYASPALTCEAGSVATIESLETRAGLVGVYTESAACAVRNSRLQALHYGIVARGIEPNVSTTSISASKENIKEIKN